MNILPKPKSLSRKEGAFLFGNRAVMQANHVFPDSRKARMLS